MDLATLDLSLADIDAMVGIVRAAPPERFYMGAYYDETACGTAACIAGWCAWDRRFRGRVGADGDAGYRLTQIAIPALDGAGLLESFDPYKDAPPHSRWFIYGGASDERFSEVDDEPFDATPAEIACLGADYAHGLNEREAALNRLGLVRACLVKWRAAIVATMPAERDLAFATPSTPAGVAL